MLNSNNIIDVYGLNSTALDKALGGKVGDGMQAHHIIPEEIWKANQDYFDGLGLKMDVASNGILLPDSVDKITPDGPQIAHRGSHGQYSAEIGRRVMDIKTNIPDKNLAKQAIEDLQIEYKGKLQSGDVPNINKKLH